MYAATSNAASCAFAVANDILHVESLAVALPRKRAREGVTEVCHDPSQDGYVVQNDHVSVEDERETHTFEPLLHMVIGYSWAAAEGLTNGNLKSKTGNSEEEERDEVGDLRYSACQHDASIDTDLCSLTTYEPLESKVVVNLRWLVHIVSTCCIAHGEYVVYSRIEECFPSQRSRPLQQE